MTRIPTGDELRQHVFDLAQRVVRARVIESDLLQPEEALAIPHIRVALVGRIHDETTYAVALHELGHLAAPFGSLRVAGGGQSANLSRTEEDAAWQWARSFALIWTPVMDALAQWAEGTYAAPAAAAPTPPAPTPAHVPQQIDWSRWKR